MALSVLTYSIDKAGRLYTMSRVYVSVCRVCLPATQRRNDHRATRTLCDTIRNGREISISYFTTIRSERKPWLVRRSHTRQCWATCKVSAFMQEFGVYGTWACKTDHEAARAGPPELSNLDDYTGASSSLTCGDLVTLIIDVVAARCEPMQD